MRNSNFEGPQEKGAKARDARKAPARTPGVRHHPPRPGTVIPAANPRHRPTKPNRPKSLSALAWETTPKTKPKKNLKITLASL